MSETAKCDQCEKVHQVSDLLGYRDFWSRIEVGGTMPAGDCPDCGAFCYIEELVKNLRIVVTLEGGIVCGVVSDTPGKFIVTDYDNWADSIHVAEISQGGDHVDKAEVYSGILSVEPVRLDKIFEVVENVLSSKDDADDV